MSDDIWDLAQDMAELILERDFYKRRCEALQRAQSHFREPERTWVCNILANGQPTAFGDICRTSPMTTERVFCVHCMQVTDCTVKRVVDGWIWTCTKCDREADSDWADTEYEER